MTFSSALRRVEAAIAACEKQASSLDEVSKLAALLDGEKARIEWSNAPYVCPGCHAVGEEPCAPGCIDAEIEAERDSVWVGCADDYNDCDSLGQLWEDDGRRP